MIATAAIRTIASLVVPVVAFIVLYAGFIFLRDADAPKIVVVVVAIVWGVGGIGLLYYVANWLVERLPGAARPGFKRTFCAEACHVPTSGLRRLGIALAVAVAVLMGAFAAVPLFTDADAARKSAARLGAAHDLRLLDVVLLGPRDAHARRFRRRLAAVVGVGCRALVACFARTFRHR